MFGGTIAAEKPGDPAGFEGGQPSQIIRIIAHRDQHEKLRHHVAQTKSTMHAAHPIQSCGIKVKWRAGEVGQGHGGSFSERRI